MNIIVEFRYDRSLVMVGVMLLVFLHMVDPMLGSH